jgi:hypothetical protein
MIINNHFRQPIPTRVVRKFCVHRPQTEHFWGKTANPNA